VIDIVSTVPTLVTYESHTLYFLKIVRIVHFSTLKRIIQKLLIYVTVP